VSDPFLIIHVIDTGVNNAYYQKMLNIRQTIEYFHLIFLDHLGKKIDKRLYTLKGGCNLRFYFQSFRYSEDIDLDTQIISPGTLRKNIATILESKSLINTLQTNGISIANTSTPKQTETTQRWKIALKIIGSNLDAHTKIEFSRRGKNDGTLFEAIDSSITRQYSLPPVFLNHYDRTATILQKIVALAERNVTQARDIFDLYLLVGNKPPIALSEIKDHQLKIQTEKALENLSNINYQDFQSQVVTYLTTEYQKIYSSQEIWQQIIMSVKQTLSEIPNAIK
jgi:predicted nucleotidyltransferase component of viral defense system